MENGWQITCGPPLPFSSSMLASSTLTPQQEPRNQMKINLGPCVLPQNAQEPILISPGIKPASNFPYMLNFGSCKPVTAESGHSFLSVVSVPPSVLQHDFQHQSTGKSFSSSYYPAKSALCPPGTSQSWSSPQNSGCLNPNKPTPAPGIHSAFPIRPSPSTSNYNFQGQHNDRDPLRAVAPHCSLRTDTGTSTPQRLNCPPSQSSYGEVSNVSSGNSMLEASRQVPSSVAMKQTSVESECPRVFCLSACGKLLLSNTGLLGILCSCHDLHMSVAKFCEHSGLSDVNPGYAVRMDSGECIAQWRKSYLQKFGIAAPDDHKGWDWPEGLLTTSNLVRSSVSVPEGSKVFDLSRLFTSSAESSKSSQPMNNVFPSNPQKGHDFTNKVSKTEQLGFGYPQYAALMGHNVSSQRNSLTMTDNRVITCRVPSCLMMPKTSAEAPKNDCQSSSFHSGIISSSENSFCLAYQNMQSVGSKTHNALKDKITLQRSAVPSSVNLTSPQWEWGVGSTTFSTTRSSIKDLQTTTFREQFAGNSRVVEHGEKPLHFHSISNLGKTKEQSTLDLLNKEPSIANGGFDLERWKGRLYKNSKISPPIPLANTSAESSSVHHKENNNGIKESHRFMASGLRPQPQEDISKLLELSRNGVDGPIWPSRSNDLAVRKKQNSTTDTSCGHRSSVGRDTSFKLYAQQMENFGLFSNGGRASHPNKFTVPDEKCNLHGMAGTLSDFCCASNLVENACSQGSSLDPGHVRSSLGFGPCSDSAFVNKDVLAVGNANQFLKEKLADVSMARHWGQFTTDSSIPNALLNSGSKPACDVGNGTASEGNNTWDDVRVFTHGMGFDSNVTANYVQSPCALQPKEQPSPRGESKVSGCNMFQSCCEGSYTCISGRCCRVSPLPSNEERYSKSTGFVDGLTEQVSVAVVDAAKIDRFRLSDKSSPVGKEIPVICSQKMKEHTHGKLDFWASQWRDVPPKANPVSKTGCSTVSKKNLGKNGDVFPKVNPVSKMGCLSMSKRNLGKNGEAESHLKVIHAERISNDQVVQSQENESSNISSRNSAPVVTQVSIEVEKIDSSTVNAVDTEKGNDQLVDQGFVSDISSSDAIDSVKSSQPASCWKARSAVEESPAELLNAVPHSFADEFKRKYTESKKLPVLNNENGLKPGKRKHMIKSKTLGSSLSFSHVSLLPSESTVCTKNAPDNHDCAAEDVQVRLQSNQISCNVFESDIKDHHSFKRRKSSFSSVKVLSRKRDLNGIYSVIDSEIEDPVVKRFRQVKPDESVVKPVKAIEAGKEFCLYNPDSEGTLKHSVSNQKPVLVSDANVCNRKSKPVACGKYGIICNQELDLDELKPPKIILLDQVLRSCQRISKFGKETAKASTRTVVHSSDGHKTMCGSFTFGNVQVSKVLLQQGAFCETSGCGTLPTYHKEDGMSADDLSALGKVGVCGTKRKTGFLSSCSATQSKPKELRIRSLYELSMRGKEVLSAEFSLCQTVMCEVSTECEPKKEASKGTGESGGDECSSVIRSSLEKPTSSSHISEQDARCCVCGIPNEDNSNCLLECGGCFIRIHQACYGISRVPKGDWYCRPCKTGAKNVACVLCGYGSGAVTRAFGSRGVVKSLLKAWNIKTEESHVMGLGYAETLYVPAKMDSDTAKFRPSSSIKPVMHNSIIASLFDRTVRQWVHMVCGLWTPGTRCPNVDTMSAFDVSGVSRSKAQMVCHICTRPGGSCIRCFVGTCNSYFHPWCAHQKGLLQSEVECFDSHKVRFYGRCLLHADHQPSGQESDTDNEKSDSETVGDKEATCARTEVYMGTKLQGRKHRYHRHKGKGKCFVSQVQLDAWFYINKHKLGLRKLPKPPVSDADLDYRKEYARYKQVKGWKQLAVYKSGIHALGLYTSQFIPRGAMVVEYVGEIVGPRVADKRESEYLSGRKLQYKSACYFFRIDKEQIIDATRKGGIARFVNHSCQPNCVAKVIVVRSEKKVVFFAQRDINPGEEITYDYHFNREDEGKKIPCFCKSPNCRRYLN